MEVVRSASLSRNWLPARYDGWELRTSPIISTTHFFFRGMEQPRAVESPASLPRLLRLKWNSSYIPLRKTGREKELMSDIKQGSLMVNHIPPGRSKMRLIQSQDTYTDFALERLLCEFFFDCLPSSLLVSSWKQSPPFPHAWLILFLIGLGRI